MLILKRRRDQVVRIGPDVRVQVLSIEQGAVTLGIDAPPEWKISRVTPAPEGSDHASPQDRA